MPIIETSHDVNGQKVQINIEMESAPQTNVYGETRTAAEALLKSARDYFSDGMTLTRHCATSMVETLQTMAASTRPDEVQLELAIKLDAQAGAVLARLGTEAQLQVTLKWTTTKPGK